MSRPYSLLSSVVFSPLLVKAILIFPLLISMPYHRAFKSSKLVKSASSSINKLDPAMRWMSSVNLRFVISFPQTARVPVKPS